MLLSGLALFAAAIPGFVQATPVAPRQAITPLTAAQIAAFKPYSFYAATAYCQPSTTINWSCGTNCKANPTFVPIASGGNGTSVQFWYVGWDPSLKTLIVAHQGTDTSHILPLITDADFPLDPLDPTLFPGISSSVETHDGFGNEQALTATQILSAVQTGMKRFSTNKVTVVGHSLGAAIGLIDSVYLPLHIPGIQLSFIGYGMPRVGNQAFADYLDAHLPKLVTHINNKEDVVPILPGRFLGFHHPSGEVHIMDNNQWVSCPGQDNPSSQCTTGDVGNIFEGDTGDHEGPYDGVNMTCG